MNDGTRVKGAFVLFAADEQADLYGPLVDAEGHDAVQISKCDCHEVEALRERGRAARDPYLGALAIGAFVFLSDKTRE